MDPITRLNAALEGRYRIESELGEGGMATVYLADDLKHERKVALKVLKPELAAVVGAERFLAEIKTTANLQHPHILPLHDSGEADGFLYYVMPYIEGETLRDRLEREKQLPVDDAVRIASDVAEALHSAHEQGVIHRDIKPANILLSKGRPLVADFGIALAVAQAGGGRLTETGLSMGTPYYMSPEQASADRDPSAASDVYSLGCVLYEMLVGEPPHVGNTAQAVLGKILTETPRAPAVVRASVPGNVDGAVLKSLEKLPADRFSTASGLVAALSDSGFRYGTGGRIEEAAKRHTGAWRPAALSLGAVSLVVAALAAWGWLRPASAPVTRFEVTIPPGLNVFLGNGVAMTLSPDGSQIVFVGADSTTITRLWLRALDRLEVTPIPGTENARNPRFSPDGRSVAFTGDEGLSTVSLSGAPPLRLVSDSVPSGGGGLAWGVDDMLYFRKEGQGIWRVPANGGEQEEVTALAEGEAGHTWLDALPNGKGVIFTRDVGSVSEDQIAVVSLETGESTTLLQGAMGRYVRSGYIVYTAGDGNILAAPFDAGRLEITGSTSASLETTQVNTGSASQFALSQVGSLIYWPGSGVEGGRPEWVSTDGSTRPLDVGVVGHFHKGALSPDGTKVALTHSRDTSQHDIWIYDLDQGTFSRLTRESDNTQPFWSPDSKGVAFRSIRGGQAGLFLRAWDGSGEATLLVGEDQSVNHGTWSPDGEWIIYSVDAGAGDALRYVRPLPDSVSHVLLDDGFNNLTPVLSPDGRWLAYTSDESGQPDVYVRPFPGPGGRRQVSVGGGAEPVWMHDARGLIYRSTPTTWTVATVITNPEFAVTGRDVFLQTGDVVSSTRGLEYSVSRDDQSLLVIKTLAQGAGERLIVVMNWLQELEQLTGN